MSQPGGAVEEIERRFLVRSLPEFPLPPGELIEQGYLAFGEDGAEVRVRRRSGASILTVKQGRGLVRREYEVVLSAEQSGVLWEATANTRLEKVRHKIAHGEFQIELDIYRGVLSGLAVAEVEFPSTTASAQFVPPAWCGPEVTDDPRFRNQAVVRLAAQELAQLLTQF